MKTKREKIIILLMLILFIILFIYSIVNIVIWYTNNDKNDTIKKELDKSIEIIKDNEEEKYKIDFEELKKKNSDTIAYIKVKNTNIDYVVVKGKDNEYYLKHNFNKEWNIAGWIFADYHNQFNGRDKNIVIYGHNTKNGSMFGTLHDTLKEDWYKNEENQKILLVTKDKEEYYQIFSLYTIKKEDYYINTEFNNDKEFKVFIDTLKTRSIYNFNVETKETDQILTLSTCTSGGVNRVVVHAKKITE